MNKGLRHKRAKDKLSKDLIPFARSQKMTRLGYDSLIENILDIVENSTEFKTYFKGGINVSNEQDNQAAGGKSRKIKHSSTGRIDRL